MRNRFGFNQWEVMSSSAPRPLTELRFLSFLAPACGRPFFWVRECVLSRGARTSLERWLEADNMCSCTWLHMKATVRMSLINVPRSPLIKFNIDDSNRLILIRNSHIPSTIDTYIRSPCLPSTNSTRNVYSPRSMFIRICDS